MKTSSPVRSGKTSRTRELKLAILASFNLSRSDLPVRLAGFREADWEKTLFWLDISGMALYFLNQVSCLGAESALPDSIETQLNKRLQQNRLRTKALLNETALLSTWLNRGGIPYAVLKGITLAPHAVPDSALRWQADLDFLVPEKYAAPAEHYIRRLGYRLHARSGRTLEFRAGVTGVANMSRMYCNHSERALELHLCSSQGNDAQRFLRREPRQLQNTSIVALSPPDILVQQALHLLKHLSGEHTRVSWVLEFWRYVKAHGFDAVFWLDVQHIAAAEPNGDLAMAIAFWLARELFGPLDFDTPSQWEAEKLPERIRLWLDLYAIEILLADSVGSKLYALLKKEIPGPPRDSRSVRQVLFPSRLPLRIAPAASDEHPMLRGKRYLAQLDHIVQRFKFHFVEGLRFAVQSARWKRAVARCEQ